MDYSYCGEEVPFNYSNLTTSNLYETRHGTHIIAIDFDGTFNASPFIFSRLIRDLKKEGVDSLPCDFPIHYSRQCRH